MNRYKIGDNFFEILNNYYNLGRKEFQTNSRNCGRNFPCGVLIKIPKIVSVLIAFAFADIFVDLQKRNNPPYMTITNGLGSLFDEN